MWAPIDTATSTPLTRDYALDCALAGPQPGTTPLTRRSWGSSGSVSVRRSSSKTTASTGVSLADKRQRPVVTACPLAEPSAIRINCQAGMRTRSASAIAACPRRSPVGSSRS